MKKFVCTVCGYVYEGEKAPEKCPVCGVGADKFIEQGEDLAFADEHRIGVAKGVDERIIEGLQANFVGECTEVGMYLAMSRQADREGFPEVAEAYKRIAFEEAEHAAKFAEMLGEVVEADTKANLQARVNAEHLSLMSSIAPAAWEVRSPISWNCSSIRAEGATPSSSNSRRSVFL